MQDSESTFHHLHWSSMLFDAIGHVRQILIPAILAVVGAARGSLFWVWIALAMLIPGVMFSVFRYLTLRYSIQDRKLIVSQGLIFRKVRTVPVDRIQNLDFVQNVLHRMLDVAEVRVETAAGGEPEASLRVLSLQEVERLRQEIFGLREPEAGLQSSPPQVASRDAMPGDSNVLAGTTWASIDSAPFAGQQVLPPVQVTPLDKGIAYPSDRSDDLSKTSETLHRIPLSMLLKVGIANNRGMVVVGVIIGLLYQADVLERINVRQFRQLLPLNWDRWSWIVAGVVLFLAILIVLRIFSMVWYVLRFYGYTMVRRGEDLRISCGLLTKVNATIPRGRIQVISVHSNLLMRWMQLSAIRVETAGGTSNREDASASVSSRWMVPVVPSSRVRELMGQIRPGLIWDESQWQFQPLSHLAARRRVRISILVGIALGAAGLAITRPWGWTLGVVTLPILIAYSLAEVRRMGYLRTAEGIIFRSGVLTRKTSITFFEKIQSVAVLQSPLDRRWTMARLLIDTAAAGPADHRMEIPMLDETTAVHEQQLVTSQAAQHEPVFQ